MNELFSMGVLIPLWILGAGLVMGIVLLTRSPAPLQHHGDRTDSANRDYAAGRDRPAVATQTV